MPLSTDEIHKSAEFLRKCCQEPLKFYQLLHLIRTGVDVRKRDQQSGLNALGLAAVGKQRQPNEMAFDYLYKQKLAPFSTDEKVEALELMGSSFILVSRLTKGLDCWHKAARLRSVPRSRLNETMAPCAIRKYVREEWTCLDDVDRMKQEIHSSSSNLNIMYQAMLVRLRYHPSSCHEDIGFLWTRLLDYNATFRDRALTVDNAKWLVFLYEWDVLYAPRSLPIEMGPNSMIRWVIFINVLCHIENRECLLCFEISKLFLGWLAREFEQSPDEHAVLRLIELVSVTLMTPLTRGESVEMKTLLQRFLAVDWRNDDEQCLMLFACYCFADRKLISASNRPIAITNEVIRLLAEAGANVNNRDKNGDTCLHLLVDSNGRLAAGSEPIVLDLLSRGLRWDVTNKQNETAQEKMNRLSDYETKGQIVSASAHYFTLKWLCLRLIRHENMHFNPEFVPKTVLEDIIMLE